MDRSKQQTHGLFVLRLALGLIFVLHGWMNIVGGQESFLREMLAMVGWTAPDLLVWLITGFELLAGLALMLGLFTREAAALLAIEMVVAVVLFHVRQGFFLVAIPNAPLAYGFEYHLSLVGGLVCLALGGSGAFALDARLRKGKGARPAASQPAG